MKALQAGIGICLIGEKYGYIDEIADADKCDAVLWANTVLWAANQRKLIDQSTLAGDSSTTAEGETICRSCSGICQTVLLPIKEGDLRGEALPTSRERALWQLNKARRTRRHRTD
jgi:hypothetical protein